MILDTNTFVSGLISTRGAPHALLIAWRERAFTLVSHPLQLDELRDVTRRAKMRGLVVRRDVGRLVNQIAEAAHMPKRLPSVARSPDPRDDFLLSLCEAGDADRLVTGDKRDLLALKRHGPATIVTAAAFAVELGLQPSPIR